MVGLGVVVGVGDPRIAPGRRIDRSPGAAVNRSLHPATAVAIGIGGIQLPVVLVGHRERRIQRSVGHVHGVGHQPGVGGSGPAVVAGGWSPGAGAAVGIAAGEGPLVAAAGVAPRVAQLVGVALVVLGHHIHRGLRSDGHLDLGVGRQLVVDTRVHQLAADVGSAAHRQGIDHLKASGLQVVVVHQAGDGQVVEPVTVRRVVGVVVRGPADVPAYLHLIVAREGRQIVFHRLPGLVVVGVLVVGVVVGPAPVAPERVLVVGVVVDETLIARSIASLAIAPIARGYLLPGLTVVGGQLQQKTIVAVVERVGVSVPQRRFHRQAQVQRRCGGRR